MDLNYLHYRQQVERMRADGAACLPLQRAHAELAAAYSALIGRARATRRRPEPA